jgi:RNA recognition motif-containing protein
VNKLAKKIYVGNLSFDATEEQINELFSQYGKVDSIAMITDRDSGNFRGFCFVEMEESAANAAIKALNDSELDGRTLRVNEARPREERSGGGGGSRQSNYRRDNRGSGSSSRNDNKKRW